MFWRKVDPKKHVMKSLAKFSKDSNEFSVIAIASKSPMGRFARLNSSKADRVKEDHVYQGSSIEYDMYKSETGLELIHSFQSLHKKVPVSKVSNLAQLHVCPLNPSPLLIEGLKSKETENRYLQVCIKLKFTWIAETVDVVEESASTAKPTQPATSTNGAQPNGLDKTQIKQMALDDLIKNALT